MQNDLYGTNSFRFTIIRHVRVLLVNFKLYFRFIDKMYCEEVVSFL